MERVTIEYKDQAAWLRLRTNDLTSTEISTIFGANKRDTYFNLWHRKKLQKQLEIEPNERMVWGNRLESTIAQGIAEDLKLDVVPFKTYMRIPEKRLGSSFDFKIADDGILEIKNVDRHIFKSEWLVDGNEVEAPIHIEMQVQHQLYVSGLEYALLGALVGGNELVTTRREPNEKVFSAIDSKTSEFWKSIDANEQPQPEWEKDADFIISLCQYTEPDKIITATSNIEELAKEYQRTSENVKFWESCKDAVKAKLLVEIGQAEKVLGKDFSISAKVTAPTMVPAFERKAFRNFRLTFKKGE